ncbi:MAG: AmmeMemoRadiSam system radical SAM enzyme [Lachnospiraceae bacterium]|nr:AmmeMemoRadiSam system radical SAM enzyme [Lachnospiraceae bacterium]
MQVCDVCFRGCRIEEGQTGACGARSCIDGRIVASNYGKITSAALDPIEKKPLREFFPGAMIFSVGSYGCNLRCPYCQNSDISWSERAFEFADEAPLFSPEEIVSRAENLMDKGNIGIAYTYNEPLVGYEFVRDTARLAREHGLINVLVTNGTAGDRVLGEIEPYIDAMNIDLKAFSDGFYRDLIKGDLEMVKAFIERAVQFCHVELTTLIIPGENDSAEEMRKLARWVSGLENRSGRIVPLHVTRFFPQFHMTDRAATPVKKVIELAEVAREYLSKVYTGNI